MLPDLHTNFSRGRSGGLVFPSLSWIIVWPFLGKKQNICPIIRKHYSWKFSVLSHPDFSEFANSAFWITSVIYSMYRRSPDFTDFTLLEIKIIEYIFPRYLSSLIIVYIIWKVWQAIFFLILNFTIFIVKFFSLKIVS